MSEQSSPKILDCITMKTAWSNHRDHQKKGTILTHFKTSLRTLNLSSS